jgi:hypothetical protein
MIRRGHAGQPIAWFEPSHPLPPQRRGNFFVSAEGVLTPSTSGSRSPFLIRILSLLHTHAWVNPEADVPTLFQEDLRQLIKAYSTKVIDPQLAKTPPELPLLFAHNHEPIQLLHQLCCPIASMIPWTIARSVEESHPIPVAIGEMEKIMHNKLLNYYWRSQTEDLEAAIQRHQPTLLQCLSVSALPLVEPIVGRSSLLDCITGPTNNAPLAEPTSVTEPPSLMHAWSESLENPRQRRKLEPITSLKLVQELLVPGTDAIIPSENKCLIMGITPSDNLLYPEIWSQQYEDQGQTLPPSIEVKPNLLQTSLLVYNDHIYVCLEDYVSRGPPNSWAMQIHDRYKPTRAKGYYICEREDTCIDVILAYPCELEQNVWLLLENQKRASLQFPQSEPNCVRLLSLNELHLLQHLSSWDILDSYHNDLVLSRQEQRLCYFEKDLHNRPLPQGWHQTILGPRTDGRKILLETFMHELGVTLPDFLLVTQHFSEVPIARYPRGSQYLIMQRYRFPSLNFFERVESYLTIAREILIS